MKNNEYTCVASCIIDIKDIDAINLPLLLATVTSIQLCKHKYVSKVNFSN